MTITRTIITAVRFAGALCAGQPNQPCLTWTGAWPGALHGKALDANNLPTPRCMTDAEIQQLIDVGRMSGDN